jgi:hypothetical protein
MLMLCLCPIQRHPCACLCGAIGTGLGAALQQAVISSFFVFRVQGPKKSGAGQSDKKKRTRRVCQQRPASKKGNPTYISRSDPQTTRSTKSCTPA